MKQTKFWILLFAALAILGCGAFLLLRSYGQTGQTAVIRIDGDVYDIEVQTEWGSNTVHVEPDGVSVTHADCPDHLCVKQGKITSSAIPIACVPHHLTVQIEGTP